MPPPLHAITNCVPPLIRPPVRVATFPQGKAILRIAVSDTKILDYTPSVMAYAMTAQ